MKKTWWISIRKLKCHEFHTTLRKVEGQLSWSEKLKLLEKLQSRAITQFVKLSGYVVLAYLLVTSLKDGEKLALKVQTFEVSLPAAYFLSITSLVFLLTTIAFCHLTVAMFLKANEGARNLNHGFSSTIYSLIKLESDDLAFGLTQFRNTFFRELFPISAVLAIGTFLGMVGALIPLFALGAFVAIQQIDLIQNTQPSLFELLASTSGIAFVLFSFLYLVLYNLPLPVQKNKFLIRWGFLIKLPNSGGHPQAAEWLQDK